MTGARPFAHGVEVVGVDGDDTLWRCQDAFDEAEQRLATLLAPWAPADVVEQTLNGLVRANLRLYGFGVKSWTLNVVETALTVSGGRVGPHVLEQALALGRALLDGPVEVLPGAAAAVDALAETHRLVLVTKGDLVDQRRKLALSGLADRFVHVEIVPAKDEAAYAELLRVLECPPDRFLMVGNSEVSDVVPVLALGGWTVHVPYRTTWVHERLAEPVVSDRRAQVETLGEVPALLRGRH